MQLITSRDKIFSNPVFDHCWYCHGAGVSDVVQRTLIHSFGLKNVTFSNGLPKNIENDKVFKDEKLAKLILIDDLMAEFGKNDFFAKLTTMFSHHRNCTVIWFVQNLFEKSLRTISLNCQYIILFDSVRDRTLLSTLNRQIFPSKPNFLIQAMQLAREKSSHPYLFIDLRAETNESLRVQTNIIPCNPTIVFQ